MKIIPLGTSSGKPTLNRNVSATAVTGEGEWSLFDCGEAAQIQIARAGLSFHKLSAIFITHLHGDHFNGLPGLLATMALDRRERGLTIVGPPGIAEYIDLLGKLRILFVNYPLDVREYGSEYFSERLQKIVFDSKHYTVVTRPLDHRIYALGYRLQEKTRPGKFNLERAIELGIPPGPLYSKLQSGRSITLEDGRVVEPSDVLGEPRPGKVVTYCLDTRPCDNAVELARGADWLIYEATYTNEYIEEAGQYGHSTAKQAASVAMEAGVKNLLLTHISSRYPDASALLNEALAVFPKCTLAHDLMEIEV